MPDPAHRGQDPTGARLDAELVRRQFARSRGQARELIRAGFVEVSGRPRTKASTLVSPDADIVLTQRPDPWVGRAAYKLLGALEMFSPRGLSVTGRRCLDVGASTGGFTQVLLVAGAAHVTALDVGHGQLAATLAGDPRVEERSGTNIREVAPDELGPPFDVVVADLSFISVRLTLSPMRSLLRPDGDLVVLVKPQFEVGRDRVGRTGVVTSVAEHTRILRAVTAEAGARGLQVLGLVPSPIRGGDGNKEYLLWMSPRVDAGRGQDVEAMIEQAKGAP